VHSAGKIRWEHLPPTCTTLSFGVGFDDEVPSDWRVNHTITVKSALYDKPTGETVEEQVVDSIYLNGDGRDGIKKVTLDTIGLGSRMIEIDLDASYNGNGHVDVIDPKLSCLTQDSALTKPPTTRPQSDIVEIPISSMTLTRKANYHGPVEVDMSLGEAEANDGRSINPESGEAFGIGSFTGWSSGLGVAPGNWDNEHAQVDVLTQKVCERITTWVGIDDEVGSNGSARFTIYADGVDVAHSGVMKGGQKPAFLSADVTGSHVITLSVDNGGDGNAYDHADWGEPTLLCSTDPAHVRGTGLTTLTAKSDDGWYSTENFWGPLETDKSLGEAGAGDGTTIRINSFGGFQTGLGMAPSSYYGQPAKVSFTVPEGCTEFTSWVGIDNEVGSNGSAQFWVWRDRNFGARSKILKGNQDPQFLVVPVKAGETLTLWVDNGGDNNAYDHADWGDPRFLCG
jgi:alpha-galactosidase